MNSATEVGNFRTAVAFFPGMVARVAKKKKGKCRIIERGCGSALPGSRKRGKREKDDFNHQESAPHV